MRADQDFSAGKDFSHLAESPPRTAFPNTSAIESVTSTRKKTRPNSCPGVHSPITVRNSKKKDSRIPVPAGTPVGTTGANDLRKTVVFVPKASATYGKRMLVRRKLAEPRENHCIWPNS